MGEFLEASEAESVISPAGTSIQAIVTDPQSQPELMPGHELLEAQLTARIRKADQPVQPETGELWTARGVEMRVISAVPFGRSWLLALTSLKD